VKRNQPAQTTIDILRIEWKKIKRSISLKKGTQDYDWR